VRQAASTAVLKLKKSRTCFCILANILNVATLKYALNYEVGVPVVVELFKVDVPEYCFVEGGLIAAACP
jgi:hypothetical protein